MPVVVEDGTGLSTAESYVSESACSTLLTALDPLAASNLFTLLSAIKQSVALRASARELDRMTRARLQGARKKATQALLWPRAGVFTDDGYLVDDDSVPQAIKDAQCYLAWAWTDADAAASATGPNLLAPNVPTGAGALTSEAVQVGPIKIDSAWGAGAAESPRYLVAMSLVEHLLVPGGRAILA